MYGEGSDEGGKVGVDEKGGDKEGRDNEGDASDGRVRVFGLVSGYLLRKRTEVAPCNCLNGSPWGLWVLKSIYSRGVFRRILKTSKKSLSKGVTKTKVQQ